MRSPDLVFVGWLVCSGNRPISCCFTKRLRDIPDHIRLQVVASFQTFRDVTVFLTMTYPLTLKMALDHQCWITQEFIRNAETQAPPSIQYLIAASAF